MLDKKNNTFEINIAILGHVSVGKTTVLNALLQDKFSEVSMRRNTFGINFFRVSNDQAKVDPKGKATPEESPKNGDNGSAAPAENGGKEENKKAEEEKKEEAKVPSEKESTKLAKSILPEIMSDNAKLKNLNKIQEKVFDILLEKPLVPMREDTKLVLIDIPGINDVAGSEMYKNYVETNWKTFDCIVVVMDAIQGVNTKEQVGLLQFVKENLTKQRRVPVIILGNKVDDPDDNELAHLVGEMEDKIRSVFDFPENANQCNLANILQHAQTPTEGEGNKYESNLFPIFIPVSAGNAFLYRAAHSLSSGQFGALDSGIIDKIGRNEVAAVKWKRMPQNKRLKIAYDAVGGEAEYSERLQATNFDKFLAILSYCVGGLERQAEILAEQLRLKLDNLDWAKPIGKQLVAISSRADAIGTSIENLSDTFFSLYDRNKTSAVDSYVSKMSTQELRICMDQLIDFVENAVGKIQDRQAKEKATDLMIELVDILLSTVTEKSLSLDMDKICSAFPRADLKVFTWSERFQCWSDGSRKTVYTKKDEYPVPDCPTRWKQLTDKGRDQWQDRGNGKIVSSKRCPALKPPSWETLNPLDWDCVISSLLLLMYDKHFAVNFGPQAQKLDQIRTQMRALAADKDGFAFGVIVEECSKGKYMDGIFVPDDIIKYQTVHQLEMPQTPSDANHFGHVAWKFCEFMCRNDERSSCQG